MSQNVNVNLVPGNYPKEFHVSQYDVGRQLVANIVDSTGAYSIPSGATVTLVGTKPSGFGFTLSGSVGSGGVVTFSTTATVTAEYGRIPCELRITSGDTVLGTANLMLIVEESPHQEGVIDGNSETVIPELTILVERVEAAASNVLDMQVEADTLPAGSSATYLYDEETNTATFGIPQGEAGAGAAGVVASAYSASSTYAVGDYVIHDGNLYRCTTAITTAEAFTAAHWTQVVLGDDVSDLKSEIKDELSVLVTDETIQSSWSFSTSTNAGIVNTIRFSASLCAEESVLESVSVKTRNEDSGSISICLAEVNGTTASVYAVIPITLHTNPATNIEYVNGVDFNYADKVRANTIFGVWADHSVQVNFGTETVKSYATSTTTPLNHTFSISPANNYNVAVAFKATVKVPIAQTTTKVVVFGDSWTDIVNTTWTRWPVLINSLDEYDVTSYGVTGSTISGHVANQVNNFLTASATADVFIMMGGINDYRGGVANTNIISAVQGYYASLHEAYPNARFIYLANNQLYYTAHQLKYFNTIVEQLNASGIEAYSMFAWASPSQYADDFLHLGNAGNICLANNILKLLRGGEIKTVVNRLHWDIMNDQNARIGQMNIYEFYENGYPRIEVKAIASSALANQTKVRTITTKSFFTSAPWSVFPYAIDDISKRLRLYTPTTERLDSNNQVTSFDITLVTNATGTIFTTSGNGLVYDN